MSIFSQREEEIFARAIELGSPVEAIELARRECPDVELRARIEKLISRHFETQGFLDAPAVASGADVGSMMEIDNVDVAAGTTIGPYKLLQRIGEGGMGAVYMAQQTEPVERRVAVKIIKPGMDTRQVIARFEAERQALAMMDHPNIAKVLDAGTTDQGRPYFVMELVKGVPITQYCDSQHLSPRERLELFIPVCQAVQHAHQKGIIHRDLKPSNVMVALYDGRPIPKVIDFGVAKATGGNLTDKTMFTQLGQVVGTLEYMSPEQAHMNQLDVDTRSDIYSLGTILYEILTGTTPFTRKRFRSAALDEVMRIIREEDPPSPSTRVSTTENIASIAAKRHVEPKRLSSIIKGDLDWVVMKSLEKDRARRYETANGMAMDIQRYLDNEPVTACPPSTRYRLNKFIQRNRVAALAGSLVAVALVAGLTMATWGFFTARAATATAIEQRDEALTQRRRAREAFDAVLSPEGLGWLKTQDTLLPEQKRFLETALKYYQEFAADSATQTEGKILVGKAHRRVGQTLQVLGQPTEATEAYQKAIEIFEAIVDEATDPIVISKELADSYDSLGSITSNQSREELENKYRRKAIEYQETVVELQPKNNKAKLRLAKLRLWLGLNLRSQYDPQGAVREYYSSLGLIDQVIKEQPSDNWAQIEKMEALQQLYWCQIGELRDEQAALKSLRQLIKNGKSIEPKIQSSPEGLDQRIRIFKLLMDAYNDSGESQKGIEYGFKLAEQHEIQIRRFPSATNYRYDAADNYSFLGQYYLLNAKLKEAENTFGRAIELVEDLIEQNRDSENSNYRIILSRSCRGLAQILDFQERFEEADDYWSRSKESAQGNKQFWILQHVNSRANAGRTNEAFELLKDVSDWKSFHEKHPENLMLLAQAYSNCIANLEGEDDPRSNAMRKQAVENLQNLVEFNPSPAVVYNAALLALKRGFTDEYHRLCRSAFVDENQIELDPHVAAFLLASGPTADNSAAQADLDRAIELMRPLIAENAMHYQFTTFGALLYRAGKFDEAVNILNKSIELQRKDDSQTMGYLFLSMALAAKGDLATAQKTFDKAKQHGIGNTWYSKTGLDLFVAEAETAIRLLEQQEKREQPK